MICNERVADLASIAHERPHQQSYDRELDDCHRVHEASECFGTQHSSRELLGFAAFRGTSFVSGSSMVAAGSAATAGSGSTVSLIRFRFAVNSASYVSAAIRGSRSITPSGTETEIAVVVMLRR